MFTQNCRTTNIAQGCLKLHEVIKLHSRGISSYKVFKGNNCNIDYSAILEPITLPASCNFLVPVIFPV